MRFFRWRHSSTIIAALLIAALGAFPSQAQTARQLLLGQNRQPSLALNFLTSQLDPRVVFSRASNSTYFDVSGALQTASSGVPRFDYDPLTHALRGFLVEPQVTNQVRNNTMQGASVGFLPTYWSVSLVSGLSSAVTAVGTVAGVNEIDLQITGTPGTIGSNIVCFEGGTQVAAAQGQVWGSSAFAALSGGSLTNVAALWVEARERASGGGFLVDNLVANLSGITSTLTRYGGAVALSNASTAFVQPCILFSAANTTTPINMTLRIGMPQLELSNLITSVIATSGSVATRAADDPFVFASRFRISPSTGTMACTHIPEYGVSGRCGALISIDGGGGRTTITQCSASISTTGSVGYYDSNVNVGGTTATNSAPLVVNKAALSWNGITQIGASNGVTATFTSAVPFAAQLPPVLGIGLGTRAQGDTTANLSGWFQACYYYPRAMSAAELARLTQ